MEIFVQQILQVRITFTSPPAIPSMRLFLEDLWKTTLRSACNSRAWQKHGLEKKTYTPLHELNFYVETYDGFHIR